MLGFLHFMGCNLRQCGKKKLQTLLRVSPDSACDRRKKTGQRPVFLASERNIISCRREQQQERQQEQQLQRA